MKTKLLLASGSSSKAWIREARLESGVVRATFIGDQRSSYWQTELRVISRGFPVEEVHSGMDRINRFLIDIPENIPGSLEAEPTVYVNPLEELLNGMERMLRQPAGCFEQVSSSNYPNLLVLDLLREAGESKPEIETNARWLVEEAYRLLTTYALPGGGFHWWGKDPGHEALTAYGIIEFVDMQRVFPVDQALIDRAAGWLLGRRDGQGSWRQSGPHSHNWQGGAGVRDAYIVWALCEAGMGSKITGESTTYILWLWLVVIPIVWRC